MNQPYLFRDSLHIECVLCGASIQQVDTLNAPKVGGICEECEKLDQEMRRNHVVAVDHESDLSVA